VLKKATSSDTMSAAALEHGDGQLLQWADRTLVGISGSAWIAELHSMFPESAHGEPHTDIEVVKISLPCADCWSKVWSASWSVQIHQELSDQLCIDRKTLCALHSVLPMSLPVSDESKLNWPDLISLEKTLNSDSKLSKPCYCSIQSASGCSHELARQGCSCPNQCPCMYWVMHLEIPKDRSCSASSIRASRTAGSIFFQFQSLISSLNIVQGGEDIINNGLSRLWMVRTSARTDHSPENWT